MSTEGHHQDHLSCKPSLTCQVRQLRLARGIRTQKDLANQIGIPNYHISRWENDLTLPSPEHAAMLADFFSVSMDEIFGRPRFV